MSVTITPYFNPTSITGCQLWLDAADSSSITGTTTVTQWRDKSGNTRHMGVGSGTTSYSSSAIQLTNSYMFVTSAVNLINVTVFIIAKTTGPGNQTVFTGRPNSNVNWDSLDGFGFYMDETTAVRFYGQQPSGKFSTFSVNTSTPRLFSFKSSGTSVSGWYQGVSQTGGTLSSTRTSTAQGFAIGGEWAGSSYGNFTTNASLYEIIVYNSDITDNQRQQVESYLAQKWDLTASLSADHPGRNAILYRSLVPAPIKVTAYSFPASTIVYTGSLIPYTVPAACTSLTFNMWGAGGSGGSGNPGGGGAYLTGRIAVTSGEVLQLIVGKGGQYGTATQWSTMINAEGGGGGGGGLSGQGGQGGGRTAIQKLISASYTEVVTAGGGGSAGGNAGTYGGNAYYTGTSQNAGTTYGQGRVPTGGSATTGGLNTFVARVGFPWDGTQFTGGFASNAISVSPVTGPCGGGGGGGGYYGGGGGGRSGADTYGGGGGGSYNNGTYITSFSGSNGTSNVAVASGIAGYITGCGRGGNSGSTNNGSNGVIVITPVSPNPIAAFKTSYFTPTQISNCLIWFDAADSTKFSLTGTTVNSWTSKGSYTGNAAANVGTVTSGTVTQNGLNVVRFPAGSQITYTVAMPNQARTWFFVMRNTTQMASNKTYWLPINQSGGSQDSIVVTYGSGGSTYTIYMGPAGVSVTVSTNVMPEPFNEMKVYVMQNSAVSTASNAVSINGSTYALNNNSLASGFATGSLTYSISTNWPNVGMDLCEMIVYNGEITTLQRQQGEGYLAQKWGLTSSLPADHPGKTSIFYRN